MFPSYGHIGFFIPIEWKIPKPPKGWNMLIPWRHDVLFALSHTCLDQSDGALYRVIIKRYCKLTILCICTTCTYMYDSLKKVTYSRAVLVQVQPLEKFCLVVLNIIFQHLQIALAIVTQTSVQACQELITIKQTNQRERQHLEHWVVLFNVENTYNVIDVAKYDWKIYELVFVTVVLYWLTTKDFSQ